MPTKKEIDDKVKEVFKYAKTLIGLKYTWWTGDDREDFHYYDAPKSKTFIKKHGVACSGFVNLLMHKAGVNLPSSGKLWKHRGGTGFWYYKWKEQKKLKPFDYTKKYPLGTILFRKYRDVKDQGHFAVLYSYNKKHPDKILYGEIIHAYAEDEKGGRVGTTILGYSHFWDMVGTEGYYEYVIEPKDWLF